MSNSLISMVALPRATDREGVKVGDLFWATSGESGYRCCSGATAAAADLPDTLSSSRALAATSTTLADAAAHACRPAAASSRGCKRSAGALRKRTAQRPAGSEDRWTYPDIEHVE